MNNILRRILLLFSAVAAVILWQTPAEAARSFTITQIPASGLELVLATAQTVTFRITNTSTAGETISSVRFRTLTGSYSTFPSASTPPTGWNLTATTYPATTITFNANTTADRIPPTGVNYKDFVITIRGAAATDIANDHLRDIRATFRTTTGGTSTTTISNPGSWTWKSLLMTLVPSATTVGTNCQFTLTMTVTNKSTTNGLVITSIAKPPTATTGNGASVSTGSNPANLTLNAGATGAMSWIYTVNNAVNGTVYFRACAGTGANCTTVSGTSRTSSIVQSATVTITSGLSCGLSSNLTVTPTCLYSGDLATIQMAVKNGTAAQVTNVLPSALTPVVTGSAAFGAFNPAVQTAISINSGLTGTFTWTAPVTGLPNDTYAVSGYATASGPITTPTTTSNVQDIDGYVVTVSPSSTNADSTNVELTWTIANYGCSNANQVSIAVPAGWTFANDAYALVNNTMGASVDTWNPVGTTLTSPNATDRIPPAPATNTGDFSLLFSQTSSATGDYVFNVTIIDDALPPVTRVKQTTVTVNPFGSGSLNDTTTTIWHENLP